MSNSDGSATGRRAEDDTVRIPVPTPDHNARSTDPDETVRLTLPPADHNARNTDPDETVRLTLPPADDTPWWAGAVDDATVEVASPAVTGGVVELSRVPATGALYRRAIVALLPGRRRSSKPTPPGTTPAPSQGTPTLPATELRLHGLTVDRGHLAAYDRVCGFRLADTLPGTYPHVLAFPLAMRLMTSAEFPFPLLGLVHIANRITLHRPVDASEPLDLSVRTADLRPHRRGQQFEVLATASVGGEPVWSGVSTYLRREPEPTEGERREPGDRPEPPAATGRWRVTPRVGTTYARVSGDRNPIHTSRIGARLLGYPRPIAHGMWSKARCLAALEGRLPEAYTVEVAFKLPIPLPGTLAFSASPAWDFALHDVDSGRPHLTGTLR
ncbi:MaoC/PaaZ C-terminal domain-containing protein [Micromonospora sp. NPDC050417]|uniref:MaoC/PaaZ C-terminal domain-containing protein n=1 Tax=Micromonospora sp. NPDC050417 TaxID=3364280 RepID=UPI0037B372E6